MNKNFFYTGSTYSKAVCFILAVFVSGLAFAQPLLYNALRISNENGLNTSNIRHLLKDKSGFIWIAVNNKIQRYDGRYTKDFYVRDSSTTYRGLAEDNEGKIWCASMTNLYYYTNRQKDFVALKDTSLPLGEYLTLAANEQKKIYVLCPRGILLLDDKSGKLILLKINGFQRPVASYYPFCAIKNMLFWSGARNIYRYNTVANKLDSVSCDPLRRIYCINEDSVWAGHVDLSQSSLISFSANKNKRIVAAQFDKKHPDNEFFLSGEVSISPDYILVLFRYKGFYVYSRLTGRFTEATILTNGDKLTIFDSPSHAFYDFGNGDWLLNIIGGLYHIGAEKTGFGHFSLYNAKEGVAGSNSIRNYAEDDRGNIWIATSNGLAKWSRANNKVKFYLPKPGRSDYINFASVRGVAVNKDKIIVAQSEGGVFLFNPASERFEQLNYARGSSGDSVRKLFHNDFITALLTLRNGNFITASNRFVYHINGKDNKVSIVNFNNGKDKIIRTRTHFEDKKGRIWFIGQTGLVVTDSNFNILHRIKNPKLNGIFTNSLAQVNDSCFWVAWEGLHEVVIRHNNQTTIQPIFTEAGSQVFFNIISDSSGYCWASSEKGIYRLYPDKKSFRIYNYSENVLNNHFSYANPFRCKDGTVLFPGNNGVTYFQPEKFSYRNDILFPSLTSIKINGEKLLVSDTEKTTLKYHQNGVEINYIAPYVYNGAKVMYRYRLEGVDKDWVYTGNNTFVRFSSLSHGSYRFKVAASLSGAEWFEISTPFSFVIKPPFWKTWWFIALSTILTGYFVVYFFQDRIRKIKKREKMKREYERKIAETEMLALRAQMNPHFVFNSLNSISMLVAGQQNEKGLEYLSKFSRLLRLVLDESENNLITLRDEIRMLDLYLQLESLRFGDSFFYTFHVEEQIEDEETLIPSLLLHPIVENAVWHGLLHKQGERRLIMNFSKTEDNMLRCVVKDNGIGIEQAKLMKQERLNGTEQKSKGLQIVQDRLKMIELEYNAKTSLVMEDMQDLNGNITGTKAIITLPFIYE